MIVPVGTVLVVVLPSRLRTHTQADQSVGTKKMVPQRKDVCTYSSTEMLLCRRRIAQCV